MFAKIAGRIDRQLAVIALVYFVSMMGMGIVTPYMNLHFSRIGLSGSAIGMIAAALPLGGIFGPPLIATFADARGSVGRVLAFTMLLAGIALYGVIVTQNPLFIAALVFVFGMLIRSVMPLLDAATLKHVATRQRGSFGRLRAWGSLGFMTAALVTGLVAAAFGIRSMLVVAVGLMMLSALFARSFPASEAVRASRGIFSGLKGLSGGTLGVNFRRFAAILLLGQVAEATQNTFFAIHMDRLGIAESMTGIAWAVAVGSEVILLWNADRLLHRFGVRTVVVTGFVAGALRWGLTAVATDPTVVVALQALHGLTFAAVYAGTVQFVHLEMPAGSQASGQAIITGARAAFAGVIGTSLVGYLSDIWSITTLYAGSAGIALLAASLMAIVVREPTDRRASRPADDPEHSDQARPSAPATTSDTKETA